MKLRKLDERVSMCFFIGYKYGGGGYRVWDPKRQAVIKTHNVVFFKEGLPAPLLHEVPVLTGNSKMPMTVTEPPTSQVPIF